MPVEHERFLVLNERRRSTVCMIRQLSRTCEASDFQQSWRTHQRQEKIVYLKIKYTLMGRKVGEKPY